MSDNQDFSTTTTSDLRQQLIEQRLRGRSAHRPDGPVFGPVSREGDLALSFAQERLWFLEELRPESSEYSVPVALRLRGRLDDRALELALTAVVARHEILRTRIEVTGGVPRQIIDELSALNLGYKDLSAENTNAFSEFCESELQKPFRLDSGPLLRAHLVRRGKDDHILLIVLHHSIFDGWSTAVLLRDLDAAYSSLSAGKSAALPDLPVQYADYAAWQREWLSGEVLGTELRYWEDQLEGLVPVELPTDHSRPEEWDSQGKTTVMVVPAELAKSVVEIGRRRGATPFMVFLSAFQVLLGRYAGTSDISVGTPVAGRGRAETDDLIGFFVNTLVMRTRLGNGITFNRLVDQVRETVLDALNHQDLPFERLVQALSPERDLSRNPLIQVMFVLQNIDTDTDGLRIGDLSGELVRVESDTAKFDLTWTLDERADGAYVLDVQYARSLFEEGTIERMAGHFIRLLESISNAPSSQVARLDLLTQDERARLTRFEPGNNADKVSLSVVELFADSVARDPASVALIHGDEEMSYDELDRRSSKLAHHLRSVGVGPEVLVAVLLPRSAEVVVTWLAILKAGGAYVPLDPQHPTKRLSYVLEDTAAPVLITDTATRTHVPEYPGRVVVLEEVDFTRLSDSTLDVELLPDSLAYVIYTSGSTGQPKGVAITHNNLSRLFSSVAADLNLSAADTWACTHSFAFDFSAWETWGALVKTSTCLIVDTPTARDPEALLRLLRERHVTVLSQTPSAFAGLTALIDRGENLGSEPRLRVVVFGGEALAPNALLPWIRTLDSRAPSFINMYGITETTVHASYRRVEPADIDCAEPRSMIGRSLSDLTLSLVDRDGELVPMGGTGELYVGGPGVARGYLNRPALTAERFLPDPLSPDIGARRYRSGDLARSRRENDFEYLGRLDRQVKIRGFRIELGEIEAALGGHPGISASVVKLVGDGSERKIAGYVVPKSRGIRVEELRAFLRMRIPHYMVPMVWVELDRLPLTSSGKVDRDSLQPPNDSRPQLAQGYVAPRNDLEARVATVWAAIIGVSKVGVHDNFFDLGGDSIKAVRLVGQLREERVDVSVASIFAHQSVAALCSASEESTTSLGQQRVAPFALVDQQVQTALPESITDAYPITAVQLGMLYEMLADPARNLYHNVTTLKFTETTGYNAVALSDAADCIVSRHEVLRTYFDLDSFAQPLQLVVGEVRAVKNFYDLKELNETEQAEEMRRFGNMRRQRRLDIAAAPLIEFDFHQADSNSFWITITECHAILDGWSHHSLVGSLMEEYRSLNENKLSARSTILPSTTRYADFVALERQLEESDSERRFWATRFDSPDSLSIPTGWGAPHASESVDVVVDFSSDLEALQRLARTAGTPLKSVLFAAHLAAIGEMTGQRNFRTGLISNGRLEVVGGDEVYGMFLNTLPFVVDLRATSWVDLVRGVFEEEIALLPHRRFPMPAMKRLWPNRSAFASVIFNYLDFHEVDDAHFDRSQAADYSPNEAALHVTTEPGSLLLTANTIHISPERLAALASQYRRILATMAAHPNSDTSTSFVGIDVSESIRDWNATGAALPHRQIQDKISYWGKEDPDRIAIRCSGTEISYGGLDARVNNLARYLQSIGVVPEQLVAVLLPRSIDLVVALLAILKAGGAYVPLDPTHPTTRNHYVITDSQASVVITDSVMCVQVPHTEATTLILEEIDWDADASDSLEQGWHLDEAAYVIYTSGSTGRPKGVLVSRQSLDNLTADFSARPFMSKDSIFVAITTISFDIAALEIFVPLAVGAQLVIANESQATDGAELSALIAASNATVMQATPVSWEMLLDHGWVPAKSFVALCGGEKMPERLGENLSSLCAEVWDLYGPTETTIWSATGRLTERGTRWSPVTNTSIHVLDRDLRPVGLDVAGELYIGGTGLARGYLNQPSLTAATFTPDPFSAKEGSRMYRTGDIARQRPYTHLEILGRLDHQVKIRGHRIELGEIEAVLSSHPSIRKAVLRPSGHGSSQILVAYVTVRDGASLDPASLRNYLEQKVPLYMLPGAWVELSEFPLTGSGKVDVGALPNSSRPEVDSTREIVQPRNEIEQKISAVFKMVLGIDVLSVEDDFFELGGHSLLALKAIGDLRRRHDFSLTLHDLVVGRTIAFLAEVAGRPAPLSRDSANSLLWYRETGGLTPLLCMHPGGGSGHWYKSLSVSVGVNQPIAAFEWPGLNGFSIPLGSIEEMAARYLIDLRAKRPHGPYRLLGWCGGAPVAWEMVQQLRLAGEEVDFTLLDPVGDLRMEENFRVELQLFRECEALFERLQGDIDYCAKSDVQEEIVRIMRTVVEDDRGDPITASSFDPSWHPRVIVWRRLLEARERYVFRRLPGTMRLVVGDELAEERHVVIRGQNLAEYTQRWEDLVMGPVEISRTPGDHFGVLQPPHVEHLAALLAGTTVRSALGR